MADDKAIGLYRHIHPIEIRFVDLDLFGHVNNAHHLTYLEQSRVTYFDRIIGYEYDWSKEGILLAKAEIDYVVPIKFKDKAFVQVRCSRLGNKSLDLSYRIIKIHEDKEILLADATTVLVAFDFVNQQSIQVPAAWKKAIIEFEHPDSVTQ
jgi:acyl-CoA thioester hydrolase